MNLINFKGNVITPPQQTELIGLKGERIVSSLNITWIDVEQAGPAIEINDIRNKVNDLQQKIDSLRYHGNMADRRQLNNLRIQMAIEVENLARLYETMGDHLLFVTNVINEQVTKAQ